MAITLVAGVAFGGVRVMLQRLIPERVRSAEAEFISLHIDDGTTEAAGGVRVSPESAKS
jgi:hypothetical protein